ncbi:MAG: S41 family peptidase [Proteobacteria bacterium]|nr:S41 family peptidase [Pseudomonadota bacterium]
MVLSFFDVKKCLLCAHVGMFICGCASQKNIDAKGSSSKEKGSLFVNSALVERAEGKQDKDDMSTAGMDLVEKALSNVGDIDAMPEGAWRCDEGGAANGELPYFVERDGYMDVVGFGVVFKLTETYLEVVSVESQRMPFSAGDRIHAVAGTAVKGANKELLLKCLFADVHAQRAVLVYKKSTGSDQRYCKEPLVYMRAVDFLTTAPIQVDMYTLQDISQNPGQTDRKVGVVKLAHLFDDDGAANDDPVNIFSWAIHALSGEGMAVLLMDLRDNVAGSKEQVNALLSVLMRPDARENSSASLSPLSISPPLTQVPVVVLLNEVSRGAALEFATAIADHGRGMVMYTSAAEKMTDCGVADVFMSADASVGVRGCAGGDMVVGGDGDDLGYRSDVDFALLTYGAAKMRQDILDDDVLDDDVIKDDVDVDLVVASQVSSDYSLLRAGKRPGRYSKDRERMILWDGVFSDSEPSQHRSTALQPSERMAINIFEDIPETTADDVMDREAAGAAALWSLALVEHQGAERDYGFSLCLQPRSEVDGVMDPQNCLPAFRDSYGKEIRIPADVIEQYSRKRAQDDQELLQSDVIRRSEEQRIAFKSVGRGVFAAAILAATNPAIGIGSIIIVAAESGSDVLAGIPGKVHQDIGIGKGLLYSSLGVVAGAFAGVGVHKSQAVLWNYLATSPSTSQHWIGRALSAKVRQFLHRATIVMLAAVGVKAAVFSRIDRAVQDTKHPFGLARQMFWPTDSQVLVDSWVDMTIDGQTSSFLQDQSHDVLKHLKDILEQYQWVKPDEIAFYCVPDLGCLSL